MDMTDPTHHTVFMDCKDSVCADVLHTDVINGVKTAAANVSTKSSTVNVSMKSSTANVSMKSIAANVSLKCDSSSRPGIETRQAAKQVENTQSGKVKELNTIKQMPPVKGTFQRSSSSQKPLISTEGDSRPLSPKSASPNSHLHFTYPALKGDNESKNRKPVMLLRTSSKTNIIPRSGVVSEDTQVLSLKPKLSFTGFTKQMLKQKYKEDGEREKADLKAKVDELEQYEQKYEAEKREKEMLQKKLDDIVLSQTDATEEMVEARVHVDRLSRENKALVVKTEKYKRDVQHMEDRIRNLEIRASQVEKAELIVETTKQALESAKIDVRGKENEMRKMMTEQEDTCLHLCNSQRKIKDLEEKIEDLKYQVRYEIRKNENVEKVIVNLENLEMIPRLKDEILEREKQLQSLQKQLNDKVALLAASRKTSKEYKDKLRTIEQNDRMVEDLRQELEISQFEVETLKLLMTGKDQLVIQKCQALDRAKMDMQSEKTRKTDKNFTSNSDSLFAKKAHSQPGVKMVKPFINGQSLTSRTTSIDMKNANTEQTRKHENSLSKSHDRSEWFNPITGHKISPERNGKIRGKVINDTFIPSSVRPQTALVHPVSRSPPFFDNSSCRPRPFLQRPSQKCLQILTSKATSPVKYQSDSKQNTKYAPSLDYVLGLGIDDVNVNVFPRESSSTDDYHSETSVSDSLFIPSESTDMEDSKQFSEQQITIEKMSEQEIEILLSEIIKIGDRVRMTLMEKAPKTYGRPKGPVRKTYCGIVKFIGPLDKDKSPTQFYIGIRLDDLCGDTDGRHQGKQYMYTPSKQGKFFRVKHLTSVLDVKSGDYICCRFLLAQVMEHKQQQAQ